MGRQAFFKNFLKKDWGEMGRALHIGYYRVIIANYICPLEDFFRQKPLFNNAVPHLLLCNCIYQTVNYYVISLKVSVKNS